MLNRRSLLGAGFAAGAAFSAGPGFAAAPFAGTQAPGFYRFRLGAFECTVVSDGFLTLPPHPTLAANATAEDVDAALRAAFLPTDRFLAESNCLLVNTGRELVLIDTGSGPTKPFGPNVGRLPDSLRAAGIEPAAVDVVVLTHAHPDHAWGIPKLDGTPLFPNARYVIAAADFDFWTDAGRQSAPDPIGGFVRGTRAALLPVAPRTTMLAPGRDVVAGLRALDATGHSPGHMAYAIESERQTLLVLGDTAIHPVFAIERLQWHFAFDVDPLLAVATRRRLLGLAAQEKVPVLGYHFPWPGLGHVEPVGEAYRYLPLPWRWG